VAALVGDQTTKALALGAADVLRPGLEIAPFLDLVLVRNPGVSFGLFGLAPWWALSSLGLAVSAAMSVWMWRAERRRMAIALGLVIGGAMGNVLDRIRFRAVTDFLDFHWGVHHWPAFNLADSFIFVGVVLLLTDSFRPARARLGQPR
jgi:signal peptidase II